MFFPQDKRDMISEAKVVKLIKIYFFICDLYEQELKFYCERFSNNNEPEFTDQEIMTIYLFCIFEEERFNIKQIYEFVENYLFSFFPKIGSYQAFNNRINRLSGTFGQLIKLIIENNIPLQCITDQCIIDSMPIITCSGKRKAKVAREIADKGYCSTKSMYYFGLKLHALGLRRIGKLPYPEQIVLTGASENDLNVFKQYWSNYYSRIFLGDKIYNDKEYFENQWFENHNEMLTPVKTVKGMCDSIKQMDMAANDLFSKSVSAIRQPIEGLFNWLIQKVDLQRANLVRSTNGLLVHVFGKLSAAFLNFIF